MAAGQNVDSYVSKIYEQANGHMTAQEEDRIKWSAAALYTGGADTVGLTSACRDFVTELIVVVREHDVAVLSGHDRQS